MIVCLAVRGGIASGRVTLPCARGSYGHNNALSAKEAGHALKSFVRLQQCQVEGLRLPMVILVDYCGYRLVAMSLLPVGQKTIA